MKYNQYDINDFLADKDFIDWVKQKSGDQTYFFQKWLDANPPNKKKALAAREILLSIKPEQLEASQEEYEEVLAHLMQSNNKMGRFSLAQSLARNIWMRYAAIFVVVITLTFMLHEIRRDSETVQSYISQENASGQKSQIRLPDGSLVYLNAASKVVYAEKFGEINREIELAGEAFFYVKEDKKMPFIVKSGNVYVKALGTSFNVKALDAREKVAVALVSGKVEVGNGAERQLTALLYPGEKVVSTPKAIHKSVYSYRDIAWKEGVIVFENASLQEVIETLQRWYGATITVEDARGTDWSYTGKFRNVSLGLVMERMSYTERFDYSMKNDSVMINF